MPDAPCPFPSCFSPELSQGADSFYFPFHQSISYRTDSPGGASPSSWPRPTAPSVSQEPLGETPETQGGRRRQRGPWSPTLALPSPCCGVCEEGAPHTAHPAQPGPRLACCPRAFPTGRRSREKALGPGHVRRVLGDLATASSLQVRPGCSGPGPLLRPCPSTACTRVAARLPDLQTRGLWVATALCPTCWCDQGSCLTVCDAEGSLGGSQRVSGVCVCVNGRVDNVTPEGAQRIAERLHADRTEPQ